MTAFEGRLATAACKLRGLVRTGARMLSFPDDERSGRVITLCATAELAARTRRAC